MLTIFLMLILLPVGLVAQNKFIPPDPYTHWDGITHWSKYQISTSGYLGPNALPVPTVHKAIIPQNISVTGLYEYYYAPGDETRDVRTQITVPVANGRVGLEFSYVPIEFFKMNSTVSRYRRTESGLAVNGYSLGDVYFGTVIQIIRDHVYLPDLTIGMSCRTASGTNRENSRYTDSPGYYFDAAFGDSYGRDRGFFQHFRWYAEVGFYSWQTYLDNYPQNDALLYGCGMDFDFKYFYINQSLRGYSGYMLNGDQPMVYRADLGIKLGSVALFVGYEKGLVDYPFQSIKAGFQIRKVQ